MAIPTQIDPTTPTGASARSLGDDQIRAFKLAVCDLFGIPNAVAIASSAMRINADGFIVELNLLGSLIDAKYIDFNDFTNGLVSGWFKGVKPHIRFVGSEAGGKDWRIGEDDGNLVIYQNTGSEAAPVWAKRLLLTSTDGDPIWFSGTAFTLKMIHGATANAVITLPPHTDQLVGQVATETLMNKTLQSIQDLEMRQNRPVKPGKHVSGTPEANGLYSQAVPKAFVSFDGATAAIATSFNVSGVVNGAAGINTVSWDRDFINTNYVVFVTCADTNIRYGRSHTKLVGSVVTVTTSGAGADTDALQVDVVAFGGQ